MSITISIHIPSDVEVPMEHRSENDYPEDWEEAEYNYRLNNCETIYYYAIKDKTVVGHLGLTSDDEVMGVYIDSDVRREGIAIKLYLKAVEELGSIWSDPSSQEAEEKKFGKSLKN